MKDQTPTTYQELTSPENSTECSYSSGSFSLSYSSVGRGERKVERCKSLPHILPDSYTHSDIGRIKERLLRTNSKVEPSVIKTFTKTQKLTLASLALADFIGFCSMSIMAPFFPREATEKGLSETMSGFVFSFYALVVFLTSPIFGKILPALGPKFLFLSGMFVAGGCNLLFGLV